MLPRALVRGEGYSPPSCRAYLLSDGTHLSDPAILATAEDRRETPVREWLCDHRAQVGSGPYPVAGRRDTHQREEGSVDLDDTRVQAGQ